MAAPDTADVVLIGGGVMGCASALALAGEGLRVLVLERSVPGAEASSAAAGILGAQTEVHEPGPFFELAQTSRSMYPAWSTRLRDATGIDIGYRKCGVLRLAFDDAAKKQILDDVAWQKEAGLEVDMLDASGVGRLEPAVSAMASFGVHFAEDGRVDPPLLLKALHIAAAAAGARFQTGTYVRSIDVVEGVARGVVLEDGTRIASAKVVLAAGSWSTLVEGIPLDPAAVRPARGQIVELETRQPVLRRVVIGQWFVSGDFFVPENKALGDSMMALKEVGWGVQMLGGGLLVLVGAAGAAVLAARGFFRRRSSSAILPLALLAMAAIPWAAFVEGHPFRIRYMVPLVAIEAIGAGIAAASWRRARVVGSLVVLALAAYELRPLDRSAPMVIEAQWDRPNLAARTRVTGCLGQPGTGRKIMASMGSLGHYMQEASESGFSIRDFLHEGNGDIWLAALDVPRYYADWILIEERAEGGDMLARRARERPSFLDGYTRVCEGAGMALYKRSEVRDLGSGSGDQAGIRNETPQ